MGSVLTVDGHKYSQLTRVYEHEPAKFFHEEKSFMKEYRNTHGGEMPHNLFTDYLRTRYNLDAERFTKYHPTLGKWFGIEAELNKPVTPGQPTTGVPNPPNNITNASVPEPSTMEMYLCIGFIGSLVLSVLSRRARK